MTRMEFNFYPNLESYENSFRIYKSTECLEAVGLQGYYFILLILSVIKKTQLQAIAIIYMLLRLIKNIARWIFGKTF